MKIERDIEKKLERQRRFQEKVGGGIKQYERIHISWKRKGLGAERGPVEEQWIGEGE